MTSQLTPEQIAELRILADKATALNLDTAQEIRQNNDECVECPVCCGDGHIEVERDYCNIDGKALGVLFYGIGEHHGLAEEYFRAFNPKTAKALLDALAFLDKRNAELNSTLGRWAVDRAQSASDLEDAEKRIAELERSVVANESVSQALRDDMRQQQTRAESAEQARYVKLPDGYAIRSGHPINDGVREVMIPKDDGPWLSRFDVEHALRVAGISLQKGDE